VRHKDRTLTEFANPLAAVSIESNGMAQLLLFSIRKIKSRMLNNSVGYRS